MKSKVLLIDDSVTIHRVIDLSIDFDRYDIVKVFSKEDAALKLQSEQFDYILLDNKLDNIIISEYISELKQQQKNATIILLVGAFDRFDETDLEKTKADDYLVKPFDSQSLNEKLSSEVDMMPAGIVERIAEADFARDNDDFIQKSSAVVQETGDVITKEEYLENLEEVQLDDLTDKGYVEDLDQTEQSSKSVEENQVEEAVEQPLVIDDIPAAVPNIEPLDDAIMEAPVTDDSTLTAVNNMVSLNDLEEDEDHEDDGSHIAEDDLPLSSIDLDEPLSVSKSNDLLEVELQDDEEVAQAISVIFFYNVLAAVLFPVLGKILGFNTFSGEAFGIFAGTAVNDTSSVTAAASTWDGMWNLGTETLDKAVTVKLTRTLAIIPITLVLAFIRTRNASRQSEQKISLKQIFPFFILYFILASIITTVATANGISPDVFNPLKTLSKFFIVMAMAAIGLNTDIIKLIKTGGKPLIMGACCWIGITGVCLALQYALGIW